MSEQQPISNELKVYTNFKMVELITPEKANELGIPAEAPVFVSPVVNTRSVCRNECGIEYSPLVYQVGYETQAQHLHKNSGGIYFSQTANIDRVAWASDASRFFRGWVALLDPKEPILYAVGARGRAGSVVTTEIRAYSTSFDQIQEGIVIKKGDKLQPASNVTRIARKGGSLEYRFKIKDGAVLFSRSKE